MDNRQLVRAGTGDFLTTRGSNVMASCSYSNSGRDIARLVALSLGAPPQFLANISQNSGTLTIISMLYLFDMEFMGSNGECVWGNEYAAGLVSMDVIPHINSRISSADILCAACLGTKNGDSYEIFNTLVRKIPGIDVARFANFFVYLMMERIIGETHVIRLLQQCESGRVLKAVMDEINERRGNTHVKNIMTSMRNKAVFTELCQGVTRKIAQAQSATS